MRCYGCMETIADNTAVCPLCGYTAAGNGENTQYLGTGKYLADTYEIGRVLGAGGFGVTYIGWDHKLRRKVAVKEYFPSNLATRMPGQEMITVFSGERGEVFRHGLERFREEAQLLMKYTGYDGIVSVYDLIETNGTAYMVMEYIDGITLKKNIEEFGKVDEENLKNFIIPTLLSLKFVHNSGYIHRDISPDNILCLPDGTVKLIDFGAARYSVMEQTQSLSVIVKQGYTPIEQYQRHGRQGPWTDIYAIGATMYKALTGITPDDSLERLAKETLKKPSECGVTVSGPMEDAVMTALNVQPEDRPQDLDEFLAILLGETAGKVVVHKKSKLPLIAGILAALAVCGGVVGLLAGRGGPEEVEPDTRVETPNVVTEKTEDAETILEEHQLLMKIRNGEFFDAERITQYVEEGYIEEGRIMAQDPTGGTPVEINSDVGVEVSKGKEQKYVPGVTDMLEETALHYMELSGFDDDFNIVIEEAPSEENMAGTVISQSIEEDASVDFDGTLTLTISSGRADGSVGDSVITLDDYIGQSFADVRTELLADDIYLVKSASVYSNEYSYGTIIDQYPEAGTEMQSGGAVYTVVSLGTEKARVPDVQYKSLEEAKQMLMEAGLSWTIEYVIEPTVEPGHVSAQEFDGIDATGGVSVAFGSVITLYVSAETTGSESPEKEEISFPEDTITIQNGETVSVEYNYSGTGTIVWSSSNRNIADVTSDGKVTGKNFGTATITAAVNGNVAFCTVYVEDDTVIQMVDEYRLEVGDTASLASEIPADIRDQVVWRSSNPAVLSVEDGTITALSTGYSSVTAAYKDQTVSCGVAVEKKKLIVSRKDIDNNTQELAVKALAKLGLTPVIETKYDNECEKGRVSDIGYTSGSSDRSSYIFYEDTVVTLYVSLGKKTITNVEIARYPDKMTYTYGETADYSGLELKITYVDGTTDTVKKDISSSTVMKQMPKQTLGITYSGFKISFDVKVNPIEVEKVTLNHKTASFEVGQAVRLTASVSPADANDKTVTWTSADNSIASVSGGTVTAKKPGTVKITAKASNGTKAECTITVTEATPASVSVTPSLYLTVGGTNTLNASVSPAYAANKSVTWSSDNKAVASVDANGKVTAVSPGTARITATTKVNGRTASCTVTVSAISPSSVTLSSASLSMKRNASSTLTATVLPANAGNRTVTWTSSNPNVVSVDSSGKITAKASGSAVITASTVNGKTASCTVTVAAPVESIKIPSSFNAEVGKTYTLTVEYTPSDAENRSCTLKSSDLSVVTVDSGAMKFTAQSAGTATITATTPNGKSASCKVTVTGEAELRLVKKPSKTEYYIGDVIDSKGLTIGYTDTSGNYRELTTGFTLTGYDMYRSGSQKVQVNYSGLKVTYDITVKTPSVEIRQIPYADGRVVLGALTDPEDFDDLKWYSSNEKILYFANNKMSGYTVLGSGTVTVTAVMKYNGIEYKDSVTVQIEGEEYSFEIYKATDGHGDAEGYAIETNIPGFDANGVKWSCSIDVDTFYNRYFFVYGNGQSYTVTATYTYGGKTYTDTYYHDGNGDYIIVDPGSDSDHAWQDWFDQWIGG